MTATNANGGSSPSPASSSVTPQATQTPGVYLTTLAYTGGPQTWMVPPTGARVGVDIAGAQGGGASAGDVPGGGGRVQAKQTVTPGQTLNVYVGGQGGAAATCRPCAGGVGGWNGGGGPGFFDPTGASSYPWAVGGGATDIRVGGTALTNRVVVAGAGGGAVESPYVASLRGSPTSSMRRVKKAWVSSSAIPSWWSTQPSSVTSCPKVTRPMRQPPRELRWTARGKPASTEQSPPRSRSSGSPRAGVRRRSHRRIPVPLRPPSFPLTWPLPGVRNAPQSRPFP